MKNSAENSTLNISQFSIQYQLKVTDRTVPPRTKHAALIAVTMCMGHILYLYDISQACKGQKNLKANCLIIIYSKKLTKSLPQSLYNICPRQKQKIIFIKYVEDLKIKQKIWLLMNFFGPNIFNFSFFRLLKNLLNQ